MSSKALRTVLFPDPDRPVRMTSWRPLLRAALSRAPLWPAALLPARFTIAGVSVLHPALVSAWYAHILAVLGHRAPRHVDAVIVKLLCDLFIRQRFCAVFFFNHFLYHTFQREQRHRAAFRAVHRFAEK